MKWPLALLALLACGPLAGCSDAAAPAAAQDLEYNRAVHEAQRARPAQLTSSERIAPATEPGTPFVLRGQAFAADGRTPLADAIVFAYHTDRDGLYRPRGEPAHTWRLKGWAKTGADGRFEFRTIRPGPYPGGTEPAHVHLTLFTADGRAYHAGGPVLDDGEQAEVEVEIRLDPSQEF